MQRGEGFDAIILAGGRSERFGGVDKVSLTVAGSSLLDRATAAVERADRIVIVGPARPTTVPVLWTLEDPPGSGPLSALAAGLRHVDRDVLAVLASDLPFVDAACVGRLIAALDGTAADAVAATDRDDRLQPLLAAYRTEPLRRRIVAQGDPTGAPLRAALEGLVLDPAPEPFGARDCDTWDELAAAYAELGDR